MGQPLALELRVRFGDILPHQALNSDCVQIQIYQGEASLAEELHVQRAQLQGVASDAVIQLRLQSRHPLAEPWVQGRLSLHCGSPLTREFTLLVNPPSAAAPPIPQHSVRPQRPTKPAHRHVAPKAPTAALSPPTTTPTPLLTVADVANLQRSHQHLIRVVAALEARLDEQALPRDHPPMSEHAPDTAAPPTTEPSSTEASPQVTAPPPQTSWWWLGSVMLLACGSSWFLYRPRHTPRQSHAPDPEEIPAIPPTTILRAQTQPPAERVVASPEAPATTHLLWPTTYGGEPSLDEPELDVPISTLDQAAAEGYLGATLAVLENTLQIRRSKSADVLLRLLDGYEALQQPMNRARVASQLEALYNVRITDTTSGEEEMPASMAQQLVSAWQQPDRPLALAKLLLTKDGSVAPLDLAPFREVLWLHHLCLEDEKAMKKGTETDALIPLHAKADDSALRLAELH
ncbi:MAG: hypothetical protein AB3X41_07010 [Leptothrix ochracea]|uniref:hypothetical protein n=1 Tax=Leptothrix ochracea TaxID=735331 RepID=UPI0034E2BD9E